MQWHEGLRTILDPMTSMGMLLMTRRVVDQELPLSKRFGMAFLGALPSAILALPAAMFGAWLAVDTRFDNLEREQAVQRASNIATTTLRESQMATFQLQCSNTQKAVGSLEARMGAVEIGLSKLQALEEARHTK